MFFEMVYHVTGQGTRDSGLLAKRLAVLLGNKVEAKSIEQTILNS